MTEIFIASISIASSGTVMDLATDTAASMAEIKQSKPDIGVVAHITAGLSVGRAVSANLQTLLDSEVP